MAQKPDTFEFKQGPSRLHGGTTGYFEAALVIISFGLGTDGSAPRRRVSLGSYGTSEALAVASLLVMSDGYGCRHEAHTVISTKLTLKELIAVRDAMPNSTAKDGFLEFIAAALQ